MQFFLVQFFLVQFFAPGVEKQTVRLAEGKTSPCPRVPACHTLHEISAKLPRCSS